MELENTAIRLKKIMNERNLRQVDLLELLKPFCKKYNVKINKSDISQYLSGKVKPGQEKLSMLGMALGVTEAWLMGYDSPKERAIDIETISKEEQEHLKDLRRLNDLGKKKVITYTKDLLDNPKFNNDNELCATKVVELPKKEKQIWEEPGKEHLMPIASHDDNLTDEERTIFNEKINDIINKLSKK